jgi:hypothetical protein|nr:MAG TPA: hypothetical protein [Caudoviricetes sp.]
MAGRTAGAVNFIFDGTKEIRDLTQYALFRGVTDWANLHQFNQFESGYGMIIVLTIPNFLKALAAKNDKYQKLIDTYVHVLEYEFRGLDGIDNMTSDTAELTNGVKSINVINKVNSQSGSTFTMRYFEKSGSIMTKVHELFLRGVKDPTTQVKHYHGLIEDGTIKEPGFDQEVFSFLYIVTDNTLMNVEKAFYIVAAQPTNADLNIYNIERGDIGFKELSVEFSGFPITNTIINQKAQSLLDWVRKGTIWDESEMTYTGVTNMKPYSKVLTPNGEGNTGKGISYTG